MRFLISYPQTNWDYAKFRLNRIIRGKDKSEQLEIIPAQVKVIEHIQVKYGCRACENGIHLNQLNLSLVVLPQPVY